MIKEFLNCWSCGSFDVSVVKIEPFQRERHFTDHIVTKKCNACGHTWKEGNVECTQQTVEKKEF
jgi:uncharacterized Zn finger protein